MGFSKHYNLRFDTNLGHDICAIRRIPCAYVGCTSMLDKPWVSSMLSKKQASYQPVANCTYWPVLGSYNNWNIIELTPKSTPFEAFYEIYKVILDGISENISSLVKSSIYGAIKIDDTTSNGLYVIKFLSEACTLQNNTTIDGEVISAGELFVKSQYLYSMQEDTNWY